MSAPAPVTNRPAALRQAAADLAVVRALLEVFRHSVPVAQRAGERLQADESGRMQARLWAMSELLASAKRSLEEPGVFLPLDRWYWAESTLAGIGDGLWSHAVGDTPADQGMEPGDLALSLRQVARWLTELAVIVTTAAEGRPVCTRPSDAERDAQGVAP